MIDTYVIGRKKTAPYRSGFRLLGRPNLHFDFSVTTSWKAKVHEAVDGLWSWVKHVDKALVYAHFELFATLLVHVRALDNCVKSLLCWKRDWSGNGGAGAKCRVYNLLCRLVNYFVVVSL
ncbi:MAG: hypothetical protein JWL85_802 [Candidatus Saccharibacteria bacterium]|nr:hypothetical protein [Candidatus Saccharibacteria bacterium]